MHTVQTKAYMIFFGFRYNLVEIKLDPNEEAPLQQGTFEYHRSENKYAHFAHSKLPPKLFNKSYQFSDLKS